MLTTRKLVTCGVRQMSSWQIFGSAMLERKALVVRKFNPLENAYHDLIAQVEKENSLLSDFELRARQEKESRDKNKAGVGDVKIRYAEDVLADWKKEAAVILDGLNYTTVTDSKSLKRCIDTPVTLLVKQKLGKQSLWLFPQSTHREDETLRETAERALTEMVGDQLQFITMGNAPCAFYQYKYPHNVRDSTGFEGAKVFYFKVQHTAGDVKLNKKIGEDHMWASFEELVSTMPKPIANAVTPAIFVPPSIDFTPFLDAIDEKEQLERLNIVKKSQ